MITFSGKMHIFEQEAHTIQEVRTMKEEKPENKDDIIDIGATEVGEDATKYGEFVSSYFAWVSLPEQKKNAKRMEGMTNNKQEGKK